MLNEGRTDKGIKQRAKEVTMMKCHVVSNLFDYTKLWLKTDNNYMLTDVKG